MAAVDRQTEVWAPTPYSREIPLKEGSGPRWELLVFRGTCRDVSIPTSSVQTDACLPAPEQGGKPGSVSVYPAEKKGSPGGDHVLAEWGIRQPR